MGTNYYAYKIPTKERKQELCNLISNSENWNEILDNIHDTYGDFEYYGKPMGGKVHLGKSSGGWKFLWDPNSYIQRHGHEVLLEESPGYKRWGWESEPDTLFQLYPLTKQGITDYVMQSDVEIYDEYGEKQDKKEFLDFAFNKEGLNAKSYYEKYQERPTFASKSELINMLISEGYDIQYPYHDFESDGLRFATSNDFS